MEGSPRIVKKFIGQSFFSPLKNQSFGGFYPLLQGLKGVIEEKIQVTPDQGSGYTE